jgi:hypothetical protein
LRERETKSFDDDDLGLTTMVGVDAVASSSDQGGGRGRVMIEQQREARLGWIKRRRSGLGVEAAQALKEVTAEH